MGHSSGRGRESAGQVRGQPGPGDGIVAGDELVAAFGGEALEFADLLGALLRRGVDQAAGNFSLAAVDGVRGVGGEHETATPRQVDDEALMAGRVSRGGYRGDAGRE